VPLCSDDMYPGIGLYEGHAFEQCSISRTNCMVDFLRLPCGARDVISVICAFWYACVMSRDNSVNILISYGVNDSTRLDLLNELRNVYMDGYNIVNSRLKRSIASTVMVHVSALEST